MKRYIMSACLLMMMAAGLVVAGAQEQVQLLSSYGPEPSTAAFKQFNLMYTGEDWQQYGQVFTEWQATLFGKIYLYVIAILPLAFLLHFIAVGAKSFSHEGKEILFFNAFCRFVHWAASVFFILLVITGLMIIFGKYLGGGSLVTIGRSIHIISAIAFTVFAVFMLLIWIKDMLPAPHDILWLFIMGGYLSKQKKPVPAGKFNAGQKMWFWMATVGSGVMAVTGYILFTFQYPTDTLRISAIIHNFLGAGLVGFLIIHLYMSIFAIKGAIKSMITGYKPEEEVRILHSRYEY